MLSEMAVRRSSLRGTESVGEGGRRASREVSEGISSVGTAALTRMGPLLLSVAIISSCLSVSLRLCV